MEIHTCQFVTSSDLFKGLFSLWEDFAESDPPFSWGDNNRSLITAESIIDHLSNSSAADEHWWLGRLIARVNKLPEGGQTYVDLEN